MVAWLHGCMAAWLHGERFILFVQAGAHSFISALPQGYDTVLGPGGTGDWDEYKLEAGKYMMMHPSCYYYRWQHHWAASLDLVLPTHH